MDNASQNSWPCEQDYLDCLEHERHMFAWTLERFGSWTPTEALAESLECYPYEPPDEDGRGLIFHDEAWHWAMLTIRGEMYWRSDPSLSAAPAEYRQESVRFENAKH